MSNVLAGLRLLGLFVIVISFYLFYRFLLIFIKHSDQKGFKLRHAFFFFVNNNMGVRSEMDLKFADGPALYVSNHRGLMDWFILRYLDAFVVAKAEFKKIFVLGKLAQYSGIIYVKRDSKVSRGNTRKTISEALRNGRSILIYPEGTTNVNKTTSHFKAGAFEEAAKNGIPVVPIAIEYKTKRDYWTKNVGTAQMFVQQFGKWRTRSRVSFGEPILNEDPEELRKLSKNWIDSQMLELQKDWSEMF